MYLLSVRWGGYGVHRGGCRPRRGVANAAAEGAASRVASRQKSTAAAPQLSRTRTGAPRAQHASRGRGHRAARRRRIASPYKLPHTDTSRDHQDTRFVSPELAARHRRFGPISRLRPSESVGFRILPGLEFSSPGPVRLRSRRPKLGTGNRASQRQGQHDEPGTNAAGQKGRHEQGRREHGRHENG